MIEQVLLVRKDLQMGVGKIAAQCSHASLGCYRDMKNRKDKLSEVDQWEKQGEPTIVLGTCKSCTLLRMLGIQSEKEMMELEMKAKNSGLQTHITADAGKTQVARGSCTVLAIMGTSFTRIHLKFC